MGGASTLLHYFSAIGLERANFFSSVHSSHLLNVLRPHGLRVLRPLPDSSVDQLTPLMASTIRFGSACGPSNTATSERATVAEENDKGNCDPDKLMQCPYDKNHQIRTCRFPYHVLKCRKNHPELARQLKTCPFNARHIVPKNELASHTQTCEDRISMDDGTSNGNAKWQVPSTAWMDPHMTENWDNEVDDYASPFVWGPNTSLTQELDRRPDNGLDVRAPNALPWCVFKP